MRNEWLQPIDWIDWTAWEENRQKLNQIKVDYDRLRRTGILAERTPFKEEEVAFWRELNNKFGK